MSIDPGVLTQIEEHYDQDIHSVMFEDDKTVSPLLAAAESKEQDDGMGRGFVVRIESYEGAAISADPTVADTINGDGNTGGRPIRNRWVVQPINLDAPFTFSRDEILAIEKMRGDEQFDVITREMDLSVKRIRNMLSQQVSGKGWGKLAQITAINANPATITVPVQLVNRFPVGGRLVAATTEDNSVLLNSAAQLIVTKQNPATGVITLSSDPTVAWANNASLFVFGAGMRITANPGQDQSQKTSISGTQAWIDPVNQGTLFGLTRTGDPKLSGLDVNCTGLDTIQSLTSMAEQLFYFGQRPDLVICSGVSWKLLQLDTDARKNVEIQIGKYQIAFTAFMLSTAFGAVPVVPDAFIEPGTALAGPFNDRLKGPKIIHSTKNLVQLDNFDGLEFVRSTATGARTFKGQFFFRGNLVIPGPGGYAAARNMPTS